MQSSGIVGGAFGAAIGRCCAVVALLAGSAAAQTGGDGGLPRVGETPPGCNTNALQVFTSVLGGNCFGGQLQYFITITNPISTSPALTCQASHVMVRFWAPNNPNVDPSDVCGSTGETVDLTPTPLTLAPGSSVSFVGGTGPGQIPALVSTQAGPGAVTAYVCVRGVSNLSMNGTPFVGSTGIDSNIGPTPTCAVSPANGCLGDQLCAVAASGVGPYSFSWIGPGDFAADTMCITPSVAGTYTAFVTDANGCVSAGGSGTVASCQPPAPNPTPPCVFCIINDPQFQRELIGPLVPQTACGIGAGMSFAGVVLMMAGARRRRR